MSEITSVDKLVTIVFGKELEEFPTISNFLGNLPEIPELTETLCFSFQYDSILYIDFMDKIVAFVFYCSCISKFNE